MEQLSPIPFRGVGASAGLQIFRMLCASTLSKFRRFLDRSVVFPQPGHGVGVVLKRSLGAEGLSSGIDGHRSATGRIDANADDSKGSGTRFSGCLKRRLSGFRCAVEIILRELTREFGLARGAYDALISMTIGSLCRRYFSSVGGIDDQSPNGVGSEVQSESKGLG